MAGNHIKAEKERIRKIVRERIRGMGEEEKREKSRAIIEKLLLIKEVENAGSILAYYSMKDEVQTQGLLITLLRRGVKLYLPLTRGGVIGVGRINSLEELERLMKKEGSIVEPEGRVFRGLSRLDLAIVPARAFDIEGRRLGRGRGYYDILLKRMGAGKKETFKIGLSFECQVFERIPSEERDVDVDMVISEERIINIA